MLVYGDHHETAQPDERLSALSEQLARISQAAPGIQRHALLVAALMDCGALLQGVADADFDQVRQDRRTRATDALTESLCALARCLCRSWDSRFADIGGLPPAPQLIALPAQVALRTPEGFAFYAVYPEAYAEAARRLGLTAPPRVIGIRSIGTSLAAVVAAALDAPRPVTVRPFGDPFTRKISIAPSLERELLEGEAHYVIVDEGPGQSGSSFGAVADWLQARGVPLERIAFLPSHAGALGPQASNDHRATWKRAQRIPADLGDQLAPLVERWTPQLIGPLDEPLLDVSGGAWRRHVCSTEQHWPAVVPAWERRKFLARAGGESFLVKFAGLGRIGERKLAMARALHSAGFTAEPVGLVHGFLVERWCEGAPLDGREKPVAEIARYIATRARLFPAEASSGASIAKLLEMSRRNASLTLGGAAAAKLDRWVKPVGAMSARVARVRTDNKLDRHEWLRLRDRRLLKTDALDHHSAHDLIGCQDIAWDIAGAIAEFELGARDTDALIDQTERALRRGVDRELLEFYRIAYLAFRIGQAVLGAEMSAGDPAETRRLARRASGYVTQLQHLLHESTADATRQESLVG